MPLKLDNPASRFHRIVEQAASCNHAARVGDVWAQVLEADSVTRTVEKLGLFYALPRHIELQLQRREDYDPHEMAWWPPFASIVCSAGFGRPFSEIVGAFDANLIGAVRSRARTLSRYFPEPVLDDTELQRLEFLIAEVKTAVASDGGIDPDTVEYILMRLARMQDVLSDINIVGAVGIREDLEKVRQDVASKVTEVQNDASDTTEDAFNKWNNRVRAVVLTLGLGGVSMGQLAAGVGAIRALQPSTIEETTEHQPQLEPEHNPSTPQEDITDAEFKPA